MPTCRLVPLNTNADCILLSGVLAATIDFWNHFSWEWGGGGSALLLKPNHNSKIERHKWLKWLKHRNTGCAVLVSQGWWYTSSESKAYFAWDSRILLVPFVPLNNAFTAKGIIYLHLLVRVTDDVWRSDPDSCCFKNHRQWCYPVRSFASFDSHSILFFFFCISDTSNSLCDCRKN